MVGLPLPFSLNFMSFYTSGGMKEGMGSTPRNFPKIQPYFLQSDALCDPFDDIPNEKCSG